VVYAFFCFFFWGGGVLGLVLGLDIDRSD
jgi:hypothetical protein